MNSELKANSDNYLDRYRDDIYNTLPYGSPCVSRGLMYAKYMTDELIKDDKVLCIGCGNGYEVVEYLLNGFDAYGTEIHKIDVPILKNRIINAVCPGLPFREDEFDLVHCTEVLEHLPEEITIPFMKELLFIGKKVFFTTSTINDPPYNTHINFHGPGWWISRLEELGCKVLNFQYNPEVHLRYEGKAICSFPDKNRVLMYVRRKDIQG